VIDGAFFGTTFCHLFFLANPHLIPPISSTQEDGEAGKRLDEYEVYCPRIFGFRVSEQARSGPRMGWLRYRSGMQ
jgi:casein kinase II subunit beta